MALSNLRCPNCKSPLSIRIEQLIDAERDPGSKARLLSGALNHVRCPVCSWEGQLAAPLVYHDPSHELLLTYVPVEINLPKNEQERLIGQLINQAIGHLPPERRKGYLLQPQAVLTMQGLVERVLQADGITREQLDEQRDRLRLLEDLIRTSDEMLPGFVAAHDSELDESFFRLASLTLQTARDARAAQALGERLQHALDLTSYGKVMAARQAEVQAAAESLSRLPEPLTREAVLDLIMQAPNEDRQSALVSLARPALDYGFFQMLSERVDHARGEDKARLTEVRDRLLKMTQEIDAVQEARLAEAGAVLQMLVQAEDLEEALQAALPAVDELFLSLLSANLQAARERGNAATLNRLTEIDRRLREIIAESLPSGLRLAQEVLSENDDAAALRRIDEAKDGVDQEFLNTLLSMAQRLEERGDAGAAARVERLHRHATGVSMRQKLAKAKGGPDMTT
ncbi:MAG TPA: CpXC domain-containing protein [Anaerolineales bacterium]|nr:CpXC domain-containing protein [Anaerolineales bacterium]